MLKKNKIKYKALAKKVFSTLILAGLAFLVFLSLISYNSFDPSPFTATDTIPENILGNFGASLSAIMIFIFGDACWLIMIIILMLVRIIFVKDVSSLDIIIRLAFSFFIIFMISMSISVFNLSSGALGKVVLSQVMKEINDYEKFEKFILTINTIIFSTIFFILISKNYKTFLISLFKLVVFF